MAIDRIRGSGVLDGTIGSDDIADDAVTSAKLDTNIALAGTLSSAGAMTATGEFKANGGAVFNEDSADVDFRVEGNGNANALFVQGSDDFIGIGTGSPKKKIHILDTTSDGNMIFDRNGTSTDHQIVFAHNYQSGGQSGGNYYGIGVDGSENKLVFAFDANSQASLSADAKMTLNSSGVLSVPSGVELGLNFAGAASNTLDDYEEGTFTPSFTQGIGSPTYTTQNGRYTKIGRVVYIETDLRLSGGTPNGSHVFLGGLPFTSSSAAPYSAFYFQYNGGWHNISYPSLWLVIAGSTYCAFYRSTDGGAIAGTSITSFTNATIRIGGWYTT